VENLDTNLRLWLTSRFDTLEKRLDGMLTAMDKMEKRHDICRTHCDETSGGVFRRLSDLEQHDIRSDVEKHATRSYEDRLMRLEEKGVQVHQGAWIRYGALFTMAIGILSLVSILLAYYWSQPK
jgi:hypothetical protein